MTTLLKKTAALTRPRLANPAADSGRGEPARTRDLQIAAVALGAITRPSGW